MSFEGIWKSEVDIFDMTGRLISKHSASQSPLLININNLKNGNYIIIGKSAEENIQQRIVIQH